MYSFKNAVLSFMKLTFTCDFMFKSIQRGLFRLTCPTIPTDENKIQNNYNTEIIGLLDYRVYNLLIYIKRNM